MFKLTTKTDPIYTQLISILIQSREENIDEDELISILHRAANLAGLFQLEAVIECYWNDEGMRRYRDEEERE